MYICVKKNSQCAAERISSILNIFFMVHKGKTLFADSQIKRRTTADQDEFILNHKELLIEVVSVFNKSMDMMLAEKSHHPPKYRDKTWAATTLNGFVVGLMRDKYPREMKKEGGNFCFLGKRAILKFKKLDNHYLPGNVRTDKANLERTQMALFDEPGWPIIYLGYTVNKSFTEITGCYAVCLDDWERIRWICDLDEIARQNNSGKILPIVSPILGQHEKSEPLVRAKIGKQRKANE